MHLRDPDLWSGGIVGVLCLVVAGLPVLIYDGADLFGPTWLWWTMLVVFLVAMQATQWLGDDVPRPAMVTLSLVMLGGAIYVVLTSPAPGFTPILLIFTAAILAYYWPPSAVFVVIALNCVVIAGATMVWSPSFFEAALMALIYGLIQLATVFAVYAERRSEALRTDLMAAHTELRATTALLAESSRGAERARIARDLHDGLGHQLTGLILNLERAAHRADGAVASDVSRARSTARALLDEVRATVSDERAIGPDLPAALRTVVADLPGLDVDLTVATTIQADEARTTALVRAVQETVTNTLRHADASRMTIELLHIDGGLELRVHDNGHGAKEPLAGNGLTGLRERIESLGGAVAITGSDIGGDGGFGVTAWLPPPADAPLTPVELTR